MDPDHWAELDPLLYHIKTNGLNLEKFGLISLDGNCWFTSMFNLCHHHGVALPEGVTSPHDLRVKTVEGIDHHPFFVDSGETNGLVWLRDIWNNDMAKFESFKQTHLINGTYTDNHENNENHTETYVLRLG